MEYFAGLDVSMAETQICICGAKRRCHSQSEGAVYACRHRGRARASSGLPADRIRDLRCSPMA
jgi:hypothetical protein